MTFDLFDTIVFCITAFSVGAMTADYLSFCRHHEHIQEILKDGWDRDNYRIATIQALRKQLAKFDHRNQPRDEKGLWKKRN